MEEDDGAWLTTMLRARVGIIEGMPRVYRAMREAEGKPALGPQDLGVRIPPDPYADVQPDASGMVLPGTGGMSVSPSLAALPDSRIPKRFRPLIPRARGSNDRKVWSMGEGSFAAGSLTSDLCLRPDPAAPSKHGFIEPQSAVSLAEYEAALGATRDLWIVDEKDTNP